MQLFKPFKGSFLSNETSCPTPVVHTSLDLTKTTTFQIRAIKSRKSDLLELYYFLQEKTGFNLTSKNIKVPETTKTLEGRERYLFEPKL